MYNENRAAISLTFDDGLASQVENALPLLKQHSIQSTFFLIKNSPFGAFDKEAWAQAILDGHEIGSHSANHRKATELFGWEAMREATESMEWIKSELDYQATSFCYPFTDAPQDLRQAVINAGYKQARGGRQARKVLTVVKDDGFDLYNVPALHVNSALFNHGEIEAWIDATLERGAWLTMMFHGIGKESDWDNVTNDRFDYLLRFLNAAKGRGLLVAPFGTVAETIR